MRATLPLILLLSLAAPLAAEEDTHVAEKAGVEIIHAWTRATDGAIADVYFEVENGRADAVQVTGGAAPGLAEGVALMGASLTAGADPTALDAMPVPAGGHFALDPGGVFLRLSGLEKPLVEGEDIEILVAIAPVGEIEIHVEIGDEDATSHGHAGHAH